MPAVNRQPTIARAPPEIQAERVAKRTEQATAAPVAAANGVIRISATASPGGPTIYAAITNPFPFATFQTLEVSTDGGMNWDVAKSQPYTNYLSSQGSYDSTIISSPTNPLIVYVGGADDGTEQFVQQSLDGGGVSGSWGEGGIDAKTFPAHTLRQCPAAPRLKHSRKN